MIRLAELRSRSSARRSPALLRTVPQRPAFEKSKFHFALVVFLYYRIRQPAVLGTAVTGLAMFFSEH